MKYCADCTTCNISEKYSKYIAQSMHVQGFHHELGLMTVLFYAELYSDSSSPFCLFDETEGRKVVESVFGFILLAGRHR